MPGTLLRVSHAVSHLILKIILYSRYYDYLYFRDKVTQDKQDPETWSSDIVSFRVHIQISLIKIQIILMHNQYLLLLYVCLCAVSTSIVIPSLEYLLIKCIFSLNNHLTWKSVYFPCESSSCFCIKKTL